jgi:predicted RNA-binding Zn ribbon-like protein
VEQKHAAFPPDWFERDRGEPASDLDLAVLLVNSVDLLEDPPDRLTDLRWLVSAMRQLGHAALSSELTPADLPALRALRATLRDAFEAESAADVARILNPALIDGGAVFQLVVEPYDAELADRGGAVRFAPLPDATGYAALAARLPAAVGAHIAEQGARRLGICKSDPCRCAFIDRTRAGTRRYCCSYCNDRAAARAYRRRKKS